MTESDPAVFQGLAERFYAEVFPTLEYLTAPNPGAAELVAQARAAGHRLVLATNPLFPRVAILHRLAWAQLEVPPEAFDLITSYETFHFTKNEPAYYAEILGRLGWPAQPVVMVGDDLVGDIQSAQRAGLAGFWVRNGAAEAPAEAITPLASGELPEVLRWLQAVDESVLQPNWQTPSAILASLRAQAAVIDTLCRDQLPERWTRRPNGT
jgi:HAD superfamily hydrolase (TIGR01549 family)